MELLWLFNIKHITKRITLIMDNLTDTLLPIDSPIDKNQGKTNPYTFDYENEAGVISAAKIRNASIGTAQIVAFNFNQGTGGTITLGGTANGNGVMQVLNASGGTVVIADNSGLTVNNGSITIKNTSGSTVIDSSGLNSLTNFQYGQGSAGTADQNITSVTPTFTDISGGSVLLSLTRQANVLINYSASGYHLDFDGLGWIRVNDGTTSYGPNVFIAGDGSGAAIMKTASASFIQNFPTGTYTLKLQATQNNSPGTLSINSQGLINTPAIINYLVLGK